MNDYKLYDTIAKFKLVDDLHLPSISLLLGIMETRPNVDTIEEIRKRLSNYVTTKNKIMAEIINSGAYRND